jgi:hypothetical protein
MTEACPQCGGTATLLQVRHEFEEFPDLGHPKEKIRLAIKVQEFRCQEQACEHEFEKIIREPSLEQ